jgi:excisionase family DNA binding protein
MAVTDSVPLLTSEVAQILQVSEATVRLWESGGRLHARRTARGVRLFDRADVERLAREREARRAAQGCSAPLAIA